MSMQQNISSVNIKFHDGKHRCLHGNDAFLFAKDVANRRKKVLLDDIQRDAIDRMRWNCGYYGCKCIKPEDSKLWKKSENFEEKHKEKIREWMIKEWRRTK